MTRSRTWPSPFVTIICAAVIALLVIGIRAGARYASERSSCVTSGIATAAAREGTCTRVFGPPGTTATTYVVADAGHRLTMPGFSVRLLETHERAYRTATLAAQDPADYPGGAGTLVSVRLAVTDRGRRPIHFDPARTDVLLDRPGSELQVPYAAAFQAYGPGARITPAGSVVVAPGRTRTGWVAFIAPQWTPSVLHVRAADLQFLQTPHHVGQIRLWKYAGRRGRAALGLSGSAGAQP